MGKKQRQLPKQSPEAVAATERANRRYATQQFSNKKMTASVPILPKQPTPPPKSRTRIQEENLPSNIDVQKEKYILLRDEENTITFRGCKLHRIQALRDLPNGVQAGDIGGYIESEANLSHRGSCWVFDDAKACEGVRIIEGATASGKAALYGNARMSGNAAVYDNVTVCDHAVIDGGSKVYNFALIEGHAKIYGNACVADSVHVCENAEIYGNARVRYDTLVAGHTKLHGDTQTMGGTYIGNDDIGQDTPLQDAETRF